MRILPFLLTLLLTLSVTNCGSSSPTPVSPSTREILIQKREAVRSWVKPVQTEHGPTFAFNGKDVGDSLLWSGLLCLSGESQFCAAIPYFQDVHGRFWRHPSRINVEKGDSFSRDMALGAIAYILKTRDIAVMDSWMTYVADNGGKLCPDDTDRRCTVTPKMYGMFYLLANHIGSNVITMKMRLGVVADDTTALIEAHSAPVGYPLHLIATQILLKRMMGSGNAILDQVSNVLVDREPHNPYFRFLRDGATARMLADLESIWPSQPPKRLNQWTFQRAWSDMSWTESVGYDMIFLVNLILMK